MFSLLRGLWDYFFRREEYYILIIGLHNVGKTVGIVVFVIDIKLHPTVILPIFQSVVFRLVPILTGIMVFHVIRIM